MCFGRNPRFMDQRKAIKGLDRLSVFPSLVDNVMSLRYLFMLWLGTFINAPVLKKVLNFVKKVFNWSDGVITHFCHFFFKIVQMTRWYFSICCEEGRKNLADVALKLECSPVVQRDYVLFIDGCEEWFNYILFDSAYFLGKLEIIIEESYKFIQFNACGIVRYQ